jgi:hypothetical protein
MKMFLQNIFVQVVLAVLAVSFTSVLLDQTRVSYLEGNSENKILEFLIGTENTPSISSYVSVGLFSFTYVFLTLKKVTTTTVVITAVTSFSVTEFFVSGVISYLVKGTVFLNKQQAVGVLTTGRKFLLGDDANIFKIVKTFFDSLFVLCIVCSVCIICVKFYFSHIIAQSPYLKKILEKTRYQNMLICIVFATVSLMYKRNMHVLIGELLYFGMKTAVVTTTYFYAKNGLDTIFGETPNPFSKPVIKVDFKLKPELKTDVKLKPEVKADVKPKTDTKVDVKVDVKPKPDAKPTSEPKPEINQKTEPKSEPKPEINQKELTVDVKVDVKPKHRSEFKYDFKPKFRPELKA